MTQSVWPFDHSSHESYSVEKTLDELRVFVICPASPPTYWNEMFGLIRGVAEQAALMLGVACKCSRAVDIVSAGIIHPEIWSSIKTADIIVADITGDNGNVLFELGVAAAWLAKDRVIIIRKESLGEPRLFDINPERQIDYTHSPLGFQRLGERLHQILLEGLAGAPFVAPTAPELVLPAKLDLTRESDARALWGPSGAHRRMLATGLEFGSLFNFRYGWLSVADLRLRNVRVSGEFRFSSPRPLGPHQPWIGIMLRSQGYLANMGHLALLRADGEVAITQEVEGRHERDLRIGQIEAFDLHSTDFIPFDIKMDEHTWRVQIGSVGRDTPIEDVPTVYADGRIIIEGQFCWTCLRTLNIESVND